MRIHLNLSIDALWLLPRSLVLKHVLSLPVLLTAHHKLVCVTFLMNKSAKRRSKGDSTYNLRAMILWETAA